MTKVALLVGISDYQPGLASLPGATRDIDAMQQVLQDESMGGFDRVQRLENPDPFTLQESVELLFSGRKKDDLALFFFSGHGIKDDRGRLYFATPKTRKNEKGNLVRATAVPASFLHDVMSGSRCKRQVVLLDCCFSGAFAEGMRAKDDGSLDLQAALGGEGRAVLTSSSSTQYSFEQAGEALSIYTRFIVEGIKTGAADGDRDGVISIDELHEYASNKVQDTAPAMKPKIYAVEEGFKINLAKAPTDDPALRYRREVEQFTHRGSISAIGRSTLDVLKTELGLSDHQATEIEATVLEPYQNYQRRLQQYDTAFAEATQRQQPITAITRKELDRYQEVLGLEDRDIATIEARHQPPTVATVPKLTPEPTPPPQPAAPQLQAQNNTPDNTPGNTQSNRSQQLRNPLIIGGTVAAIATASLTAFFFRPTPEPQNLSQFEQLIHNDYDTVNKESLPETDGELVIFQSPENDFAGNAYEKLSVPELKDRAALQTYVTDVLLKDEPAIGGAQVTGDVCPEQETFVCLTYHGQEILSGEPVKGELIAQQLTASGDQPQTLLNTLNLYSIGQPQQTHARQVDELIAAYFNVDPQQLRPQDPAQDLAADPITSQTPDQTADSLSSQTPSQTPNQTPDSAPSQTLNQTPDPGPSQTPDSATNQTPSLAPQQAADPAPSQTPNQTPGSAPRRKS